MIIPCEQCDTPFTPRRAGTRTCGPRCAQRARDKMNLLAASKDRAHRRRVATPGIRVMATPNARYRYAEGRSLGLVKCADQRDYVRVKLDMGVTFDFPSEHLEVIDDKEVTVN